jgi:hypothetical protein
MRFMPNLLGDSTNLREGLTIEFAVPNFFKFWVSGPPRNAAKGVNTSWRFVESLKTMTTYSPVLRECSSAT